MIIVIIARIIIKSYHSSIIDSCITIFYPLLVEVLILCTQSIFHNYYHLLFSVLVDDHIEPPVSLRAFLARFKRPTWRDFIKLIPILTWIQSYSMRRSGLSDLIAGATVGVLMIPQGTSLPSFAVIIISLFCNNSCYLLQSKIDNICGWV